jgi:hypothetical protein
MIRRESCNDERIGSWIQTLGYDDLIGALRLEPTVFEELYPELELAAQDLPSALSAVEQHYAICLRCRLVAENHRWAESIIDEMFSLARKSPKAKSVGQS